MSYGIVELDRRWPVVPAQGITGRVSYGVGMEFRCPCGLPHYIGQPGLEVLCPCGRAYGIVHSVAWLNGWPNLVDVAREMLRIIPASHNIHRNLLQAHIDRAPAFSAHNLLDLDDWGRHLFMINWSNYSPGTRHQVVIDYLWNGQVELTPEAP